MRRHTTTQTTEIVKQPAKAPRTANARPHICPPPPGSVLTPRQHIFYPFAIEPAGTWHEMATELTRDWQAYHHYHGRHPGDNLPVPTPFHGSAKRKCGFFPQHHCANRVNCRCSPNFVCLAKFSCLWLCAGNSNNKQICIAPERRNVRGAGAMQRVSEQRKKRKPGKKEECL